MSQSSASGRAGRDRWLMSYADLVTLLLACFATAYAATHASASRDVPLPGSPLPVNASPGSALSVLPLPERETPSLRELLLPIVTAAIGRVEMADDHRGLVISLPESAAFPTGSAEMTADARAFLRRLADVVRPTTATVRIEGHTDDVPMTSGRFATNWELSTARASAVVLYLIAEAGLEPHRLSAAGYGEFHPRVSNDTPERRALNRRVDVVVNQAPGSRPQASGPGPQAPALEGAR